MNATQTTESNADPAELARFNKLANRWWDENSEFKPLHRINPHRLEWIDSLVQLAGKQVLDVGCGGGILAESMAHRGANVTGIDLADKPLQIAQWHAQAQGVDVRYAKSSAETWAQQQAGQYDVVTCMEMLEHVPSPVAVIQACTDMVRPGGWVFFSTINRNPLSYAMAIAAAEYIMNILPRGTHQYARFIKPAELLSMANSAGLVLQDKRGLGYNPLTQHFRLHGYMGVGYLLAMQKPLKP
ncbi:bifunctional 2-polyprenyl-6-hydroxyphenol methylase/3-demethylubiquinol 3-O-methyltransferase UbiG [Undibacterium sp. CY18W]|uniref:Ubiquinone biosynthesis O-methyltransferase n=1 Tax=Undibacterium hunanense TaxID=2762292 RepID=A0ABR6ZT25_9BURK|nr:bifunctional 2-polyprenyl-6-hydroxyphenol methylase/3-demethylubiquinol 3-O-methyltransferase UbiG [Undibacterium hunanense]MBC3919030.1 bifunctional 2-polyprenyl-6-hydroxyphenol methylase/3-demethylubiquinol 3-O-methyltransferase UbiG [Undibacterium hunanense]